MSASAHDESAAAHAGHSGAHAAQYEPSARETVERTVGPVRGSIEAPDRVRTTTINPTAKHLAHAREHDERAKAHAEAAAELRGDEAAACAPRGGAEPLCPFAGLAGSATDIDGGLRLAPASGVSAEDLTAAVRCHHAHARVAGFTGMPGCPLYRKGLRVTPGAGGVDLTAEDPAGVAPLRAAVRAELAP